jgi:hypothetical protein
VKKSTVSVKLGRKRTKPVNVAAKALGQGQFRPKVEKNPKAYSRKGKQRPQAISGKPEEVEE